MQQLKSTIRRSHQTLAQDVAGVVALGVLMVTALHAPMLF